MMAAILGVASGNVGFDGWVFMWGGFCLFLGNFDIN